MNFKQAREAFHAALVDFINETWEDRPKFERACNRAWLHMKGPTRMRKTFAFVLADHLLSRQLSGKNPRLNPKSENPEKPASSSDAGNSEFNTLTLEVNPKPKSFRPDPFWDDAPGWANYWVMDPGGGAWWFENKPELQGHLRNGNPCMLWWAFGRGRLRADRLYPDDTGWETSLTSRPGIQEQQP